MTLSAALTLIESNQPTVNTTLRREVSPFLQNESQEQMETDYCGSFQNSYSPVSQQRPNAGTENMDLVEEDNYKSNFGSGNKIGMLQEFCQRMKWEMPVYIENGFLNQEQRIKCTLRGMTTEGFNISKKDAKKIAAGKMLALLNISDERFTSRPAKSNPTYASEHPIPINEFVSNSDIKSPKTVKDSTSKIPPDLAKVIELFRSLKSPKTPTISSNPDVVETMHLKFQSKEGVILNEIIEAFNYEEQDNIDYLLLLEKLSKEQHFTMQFDECESLDPIVNFSPNALEGRYSPTLNSSLTAPLKNVIFNSFTHSSSQTAEHSKDCYKGCDTRLLNVYTIFISNRICLEFGGFERFLWDIVTVASSVSSGDLKDVIHSRLDNRVICLNSYEGYLCNLLKPLVPIDRKGYQPSAVFAIFNTIAKLIYLQGAQVGVMKDCDVTKVVAESLAIFSPGEISRWVSLYTAGQVDYPGYKPIRSDGTAATSKKSVYKFIRSLPVGGFPLTDQTILGSGSPWASHFTVTFSFSFALCTTDVSMKEMGSGDKRIEACRHFFAVNIGLAGVVAFVFLVDAFKHEINAIIPIFGFGLHVDPDKERTTLVYDQHNHQRNYWQDQKRLRISNDATPLYKHPHSPSFYNTYLPFLADTSVPPLLSHIIKFPLLEHVTNRESLTFLTATGAEGCKTIASLAASTPPET
uniref:DRBM domain-containing protein n=1 Tax=Timema douglasi TaxID=61478 RepID=A0A7R8VLQ8_TIMDO|nr:unnamed protein product [Timema douglasi]